MKWIRKRIANEEKNIKIPDSDKCFSYIIVNNNPYYKEDSSKLIRKGDYMKYSKIAKKFNMEIDISHYLKQIIEMYIRFINENDRYQSFYQIK